MPLAFNAASTSRVMFRNSRRRVTSNQSSCRKDFMTEAWQESGPASTCVARIAPSTCDERKRQSFFRRRPPEEFLTNRRFGEGRRREGRVIVSGDGEPNIDVGRHWDREGG